MDGMVTHIVTRECLITQPHQAMECGVVAARRRCQEEGDSAMRRQHEDEQDKEGMPWHRSHSSAS